MGIPLFGLSASKMHLSDYVASLATVMTFALGSNCPNSLLFTSSSQCNVAADVAWPTYAFSCGHRGLSTAGQKKLKNRQSLKASHLPPTRPSLWISILLRALTCQKPPMSAITYSIRCNNNQRGSNYSFPSASHMSALNFSYHQG